MSNWCNKCGEWYPRDYLPHTCLPSWEVWCIDEPGLGDDAVTVYGREPEDAAENWAEQYDQDSADYDVAGKGQVVTVAVRKKGDEMITYHSVEGEMVPEYRAHPLTLKGCKLELRGLVRRCRYWEAGQLYGQMHDLFYEALRETSNG